MIDFSDVKTRALHDNRSDRKAVERLRSSGRHYLEREPYEKGDVIIAETTTLTPAIIGYLGFAKTKTSGNLMSNMVVGEAAVDPTLAPGDGDAVFLYLLRCLYAGFDFARRGYLMARVALDNENSRKLLEADEWSATSHLEGRSWLPYVWFAERYYNQEPD